jgi:hypothetical protein
MLISQVTNDLGVHGSNRHVDRELVDQRLPVLQDGLLALRRGLLIVHDDRIIGV